MAFPANYTRVWVRGRFVDFGKAARGETNVGLTGQVQFIPSPSVLLNADLKQIVGTKRLSATPAALDGYFAIELPSTDDPDLNPVDFTYEVIEPTGRRYNIVVPHDTPTIFDEEDPLNLEQVIELADVVPNPDPNPGMVQLLVGQTGRGVADMEFVDDELIFTMTDSEVINAGTHEHVIEFEDVPTGTTSTTVAIGDHLHTGVYATAAHNHDATYSAIAHNHDAAYAALSHTHAAADLPRVLSGVRAASVGTATYNLDASSAGGNNVDITATGNPTIAAPTNGASGQVIQFAVLGSGGSRTVTIHSAIGRLTGVEASYVVPSTKVLRLAIRYSNLTSTWIAESASVHQ